MIPGDLSALLRGVLGTWAASISRSMLLAARYPKPTSAGWASTLIALPSKPLCVLSTGECVDVASTNRGVRGTLSEDDMDEVSLRALENLSSMDLLV